MCHTFLEHLKEGLTSAPILAFPDFAQEFHMETDASGAGLGVVLTEVTTDVAHRPIAFAIRTLQAYEQSYGSTELEALGVVLAVKHFRHYIPIWTCVCGLSIYTDYEALNALLDTPHPSGKLACWGLILQEPYPWP